MTSTSGAGSHSVSSGTWTRERLERGNCMADSWMATSDAMAPRLRHVRIDGTHATLPGCSFMSCWESRACSAEWRRRGGQRGRVTSR